MLPSRLINVVSTISGTSDFINNGPGNVLCKRSGHETSDFTSGSNALFPVLARRMGGTEKDRGDTDHTFKHYLVELFVTDLGDIGLLSLQGDFRFKNERKGSEIEGTPSRILS